MIAPCVLHDDNSIEISDPTQRCDDPQLQDARIRVLGSRVALQAILCRAKPDRSAADTDRQQFWQAALD